MSSSPSIFLVGAGYIGQNVLDELLAAKYSVTTLVRRPEQASIFEKAGSKTILGSLSDHELLKSQAAQHEVTINTASCDDLPSVEAILAGVRQRVSGGQPSIYIHTGGAGALEDGALGMYKSSKIYRDDVPKDIDVLPPTSMHRHVDIPVVQAAHEFQGKAKIVIILPSLVYGLNQAHKRHSLAQPALVRFALKHGFAGYVGEGHNVWSVVHVKDLGRAYVPLLVHLQNSTAATFLENPYFFAENGSEVAMRECAEHISQFLYKTGKIQSPKAQSFTESDYNDVFGPITPVGLGCNSRSRAVRLRELGWEPKEKDIWTSWEEEELQSIVEAIDSASK
jgi:nucleoside-diphosphate-sugar epimerase